MKQIFFLLLCIYFFLPTIASAHGLGQPPFFKINSTYAGYYPISVYAGNVTIFTPPQDLAPDKYLANQPIHFAIDTTQTSFPEDIIQHTTFSWDFGDGSTASGLEATHSYKKIGSIILVINATYNQPGFTYPQAFETVLLHILPNRSYRLPKAVITIDGKKVKDPVKDTLSFDLNHPLHFTAADSQAGSAKIVSYHFGFDDGQESTAMQVSHQYNLPQYFATPVLRVTDANGFIADTFINIKNSGKNDPRTVTIVDSLPDFLLPLLIVGGLVVIGIVSFVLLPRRKQ